MNEPRQPRDNNSATRSSQGKRGLSPFWCLDPNVFQFEMEKIFLNAWIPVGHASQIDGAGDFFCASIQGQQIVVVRDKQNRLRAFQNACQHRGTQLCTDQAGQLNSAFACPYHGWKYDFDGRLVSAPNMQGVEGFRKDDFGLPEFNLKQWQGLVFVQGSESQSNEKPKLLASKLDEIADPYKLAEYQWEETVAYDIAANWKLIFQNFNECYHCPSVHPQLTPYSDYRESENDFESGLVLGGPMKIRDAAETISTDGKFCGPVGNHLPESELRNARYYTLFPNLFVSFFPDYVMVHRLQPVSLNRTRIDCDFLFHPDTKSTRDFDPAKAIKFWDQTNRQDWEICERVQIGIATPGFNPSPYSNLESLLAAFDDSYVAEMEKLGFCR